ncbi:phosphotransferase [Candidatus Uhrbacteria bacterium]|nr:phosphotransferase [Candidatus Uhrbacteria bacterium]
MDSASSITIRGIRYSFVRKREQQDIRVYRARGGYLRIGPSTLVAKERKHSEVLHRMHFPVPDIISHGTYRDQGYFVERSIGTRQFGKIFISDCEQNGKISEQHMASFLRIISRYAAVQLAAQQKKKDWRAFGQSVHLPILQKELPNKSARLRRAYARAAERLSIFPFVVSHGDFNAHNIFPRGVIDMEHVCVAPAGYDLITVMTHIEAFPEVPGYEYRRLYSFSQHQKDSYLTFVDRFFTGAGLPPPSGYIKEFRFYRMVWSAARMQRHPRLQQWRYRLLDTVMKEL